MASGDVTGTVDTEAVSGKLAAVSTADTAGAVVDTTAAIGTKGQAAPAAPPATQIDTTGVALVAAQGWAPTSTAVSGTRETTLGTIQDVGMKRTVPQTVVPLVGTYDTTRTDVKISDGLGATRPDINAPVTGTTETTAIGAVPIGSTAVPVAPAAPTAVAGDRYITVSWVAVADPSVNAKVTGYVIESDTGGHAVAAANVTSVRFTQATGGQAYKFRVRAENRNGSGAFSPLSAAAATASNSDEVRVTAITAANAANPIYNQDGTIKPGSYGAPTAPGKPTVAAGATTTANVTWTLPSTGQPSGGYDVKASTGQLVHVGPTLLTANVPGLTVANVVTFTVTAIGQLQNATSPASNNFTVV